MNLIELHILQSFPVTCLNRDDVGAPKTAIFGGCTRARVSSQCWKRAIRTYAKEKEHDKGLFGADRGHFIAERIAKALKDLRVEDAKSGEIGEQLATFLGKQNAKYKEGHKTDVALFFSRGEIAAMATAAKTQLDENGKVEPKKGALAKAIKEAQPKDMADVAVFGRMVATDPTLMVEGAGLFSHALSTHAVANEIDFFSAVDEMKQEGDEGAGHIGTLEFNSACYYRYVGLNLDLLCDESHLEHCSKEERATVIKTFLEASIMAVPTARKNSMFGFNPPVFVLGLRREGQPLSLVNAFEKPVRIKSGSGYIDPSKEVLENHWKSLKDTYSLEATAEICLPEKNLSDFIQGLMGDKHE